MKVKENIAKEKATAKAEAKAKVKEEKELAKIKAKEEKQKEKHSKKQNTMDQENIVLGPVVIETEENTLVKQGCTQILKTGPNKGKPCGCKIISENLCKRHFGKSELEIHINN
jgi:hypothetical protein